MIKKIITDRNMLLVLALVLGFIVPEYAFLFKKQALLILGIVMTMSFTAFPFKAILPLKTSIKSLLTGIFLNHIVFGFFIGIAALFFINDTDIFYGFVVVIAAAPGAAIIPFVAKLNGNLNHAIIGTFGAFVSSIVLTPLILGIATASTVSPLEVFKTVSVVILLPLIISRLFVFGKVFSIIKRSRGYVIDIGFAIIIYISIGVNSNVFVDNFGLVLKIVPVFIFIMFVLTKLYSVLMRNKLSAEDIISNKLLLSIKSSGFAIVLAMDVFNNRAAIPATIMSIMVLVYLLFLVFTKQYKDKLREH
ncbi:hypothetical protein ACFLQ5_03795 [Bacteroidota bacterium]